MIRPRQYFPWKVGRKFLTRQIVFIVLLALTVGFSLRYYAYNLFSNTHDVPMAIGEFDRYMTKLIFVALFVAISFQVWMNYKFLKPLGRLLRRARELKKGDAFEIDLSDEEIEEVISGEWLDLERALNRIQHDFQEQTEALSLEREELSALIGAVSDAIFAVDSSGEALFFNTQFSLLFGSPHAQNTSLRQTFRAPEILNAFVQVLKTGLSVGIDIRMRTSRHSLPRHFNLSIAPLNSSAGGKVFGAVGIFHDVTELKQAEQIRIEFVGNASHELRTPLTSIKGYLDTLTEDFKNKRFDSTDRFLEVIRKNVDRLMFLVNDLLDLSTIESGAELKKESVSVRELTDGVLRQLEEQRLAKKQNISADYQIDTLVGDAGRIEQVLINLVQNAIKYIPEGGNIHLHWESAIGESILRVKDNGPGIPREHLERLFERFYRVDTGRSREQGGTGLGLAIVKHVMIKHGGKVSVRSEIGEGTEFICSFPKSEVKS
jgi:two-component system phosphate regulon sensor histidine kinase PhoR